MAGYHWVALKKEIINNKTVLIGYNSQLNKTRTSDIAKVNGNSLTIGNNNSIDWSGELICIE